MDLNPILDSKQQNSLTQFPGLADTLLSTFVYRMARQTRASAGQADSNGARVANAITARTRRSHKKSRNGCSECKKRHIRCDERQPLCTNCEVAERSCSFPPPKAGNQDTRQGQRDRATQMQRIGETVVSLHGFEIGNSSDASNIYVTDAEGAHMSRAAFSQHRNHSNLEPTSEQPSHHSFLGQDSIPSITRLGTNTDQTPPLASTLQLGHVQTPPVNYLNGFLSIPDAVPKAVFIPQHMILLRQADAVPNFTGSHGSVVDIAIRYAIDSTYLLDEVLAFTAFHMAHLYPQSAAQYRNLATELQTRALASFTHLTETVPIDDKETAVPRFLFSAILGRHVLSDTLVSFCSDMHLLVDRFVECFKLTSGIRSVVPPARDYLQNSEIQPFLQVILKAQSRITLSGNECDPLNRLMDDSDLNETSAEACRQTIKLLQLSFDMCKFLDEVDYPQSASSFSVGIYAGFIDVLRKHRPEALIILAYYGVLLHRCRSFWAFHDAGAAIIRTIAGHVGSYWQEALAWPLRELELEP